MATSYCDVVKNFEKNHVHVLYHDLEYGFPLKNDDELFARLCLEINWGGWSEYDSIPQGSQCLECLYAMTDFDPTQEHGGVISGNGFSDGGKFIDAIINDAKSKLPPNTDYWFISWDQEGKRRTGWVYNLKTEREKQKLFNPLNQGIPLRT